MYYGFAFSFSPLGRDLKTFCWIVKPFFLHFVFLSCVQTSKQTRAGHKRSYELSIRMYDFQAIVSFLLRFELLLLIAPYFFFTLLYRRMQPQEPFSLSSFVCYLCAFFFPTIFSFNSIQYFNVVPARKMSKTHPEPVYPACDEKKNLTCLALLLSLLGGIAYICFDVLAFIKINRLDLHFNKFFYLLCIANGYVLMSRTSNAERHGFVCISLSLWVYVFVRTQSF